MVLFYQAKVKTLVFQLVKQCLVPLPVLTTFETPWEIINQYNAGYIFNFSKKEIQLNLDKFMTLSDEERYRMGVNAFNLIKEKFESKKYLTYMRIYTQA